MVLIFAQQFHLQSILNILLPPLVIVPILASFGWTVRWFGALDVESAGLDSNPHFTTK